TQGNGTQGNGGTQRGGTNETPRPVRSNPAPVPSESQGGGNGTNAGGTNQRGGSNTRTPTKPADQRGGGNESRVNPNNNGNGPGGTAGHTGPERSGFLGLLGKLGTKIRSGFPTRPNVKAGENDLPPPGDGATSDTAHGKAAKGDERARDEQNCGPVCELFAGSPDTSKVDPEQAPKTGPVKTSEWQQRHEDTYDGRFEETSKDQLDEYMADPNVPPGTRVTVGEPGHVWLGEKQPDGTTRYYDRDHPGEQALTSAPEGTRAAMVHGSGKGDGPKVDLSELLGPELGGKPEPAPKADENGKEEIRPGIYEVHSLDRPSEWADTKKEFKEEVALARQAEAAVTDRESAVLAMKEIGEKFARGEISRDEAIAQGSGLASFAAQDLGLIPAKKKLGIFPVKGSFTDGQHILVVTVAGERHAVGELRSSEGKSLADDSSTFLPAALFGERVHLTHPSKQLAEQSFPDLKALAEYFDVPAGQLYEGMDPSTRART
ncbi:MAG: hypothetical protein ACRDXB_01385, partial [Actinomycetes bacterium]